MPLAAVIGDIQAKAASIKMDGELANKIADKLGLVDVPRNVWIAAAGQIAACIAFMDEAVAKNDQS